MSTTRPRRRQANGRPNRCTVSMTDEQYRRWQAAADADQVTLPRWINDAVEGRPPTMIRRALYAEVTGIRTEIAGAMANLNQLARSAHTAGFDPAGWMVAVAQISRQLATVDRLADRLS